MIVGDLIKTKVPGFGTGRVSRLGIVIHGPCSPKYGYSGSVKVLHDDGSCIEWYTWQLEKINEKHQRR